MLVVGLTGGIGSGKSTVSERLVARGAIVIDADQITRALQEPGGDVFESMVERFGDQIVGADGRLDRAAVAKIVFNDADARADLEAIVHPRVGEEMAVQMAQAAESGPNPIVVLDIPLLVEKGRDDLAGTIVVDTSTVVALERLVDQRGLDAEDARARMASQVSREERLAVADHVVDNNGTLAQLDEEVDATWTWLTALAEPAGEI
jgi:dephospho-CoA kinase